MVRFVGEDTHSLGTSLIFCNGIMNDPEDAVDSAQSISRAYQGKKVYIYHNPTTIQNYFDTSMQQRMEQSRLSKGLAQLITRRIQRHQKRGFTDENNNILLLVHSHAAVITKRALKLLSQDQRSKVFVYSYGGATMIPKYLANRVENFVFDQDIISNIGNGLSGTEKTLDEKVLHRRKQLFKRVQQLEARKFRGDCEEQAILQLAKERLRENLLLSNRPYQEKSSVYHEKNRLYKLYFVQKNDRALMRDPEFKEEVQRYKSLLADYQITVLSGTPYKEPKPNDDYRYHSNMSEFASNALWNLFTLSGNIASRIFSVAENVLTNHQFNQYLPLVQYIAQMHLKH